MFTNEGFLLLFRLAVESLTDESFKEQKLLNEKIYQRYSMLKKAYEYVSKKVIDSDPNSLKNMLLEARIGDNSEG